jgi:LmbE family N-acetylglucosaminyl deacetylase
MPADAPPGDAAEKPNSRFMSRRTILKAVPLSALIAFSPIRDALAAASSGPTLNIVAHEDDDLIFLSPDLLHAIQAGGKVRTVFITAGDAGNGSGYWTGRQNGMLAAYAQMAGVSNSWTQADAGIAGHPMPLYTLSAASAISLVFMHLPDGDVDGGGFSSTHFESLEGLWTGAISTIHAIDGSSSYTKSTLVSTLTAMMSAFQAASINTQDYAGTFGDGDHSDHHAAAYFAQAATQAYSTSVAFAGYLDYSTSDLPANVTGSDLTAKSNAFYTYAPYDSDQCASPSACAGSDYEDWLQRQYLVTHASAPVANAGSNQTVQPGATVQLNGSGSTDPGGKSLTYQWTQTGGTAVTLSSSTVAQPTFTAPSSAATLTFQLVVNNGTASSSPATVTITVSTGAPNLARNATATASSAASGQGAAKAIDGVIGGYPGDSSKEWATNGGKAGSWLKLTWTTAQTIDTIVLYDRPNTNDQITGGNIAFSDGSSIAVGSLPNNGSAFMLTFAAKTVTSLQLNITAVSSTTENVGLSEIQAYRNGSSGGSQPPVANAGSNQTVQTGATVTLNGSGSSDPGGKSLTYQWTQTGGTAVTLSSSTAVQPTFTAPSSAATLTFQLVVNNGTASSSPATVTITVAAAQPPVANAGPNQTVQTGATVTLNGTGSSDPGGKSLTYQWTQTGGTAVTLSSSTVAQPTFTAPSSAATLTFQLVVNNGTASSSPATVTITVSTAAAPDLALTAKATASSAASGQGAAKAIDGVISGYPADSSKEWASNAGKAGSWLKLTWTTAQTINTIVLYDRPNTNDQITGGNIAFSDGSSIAVGSLPNAGTAYTLTFPAKTVTTLQLNITSVSSTTENVGLSEIQVYNR